MPRAQTTMDFLVGTTVFLLTVSSVFVAVPGLVDPFATGTESNTITADRAAETLATDVLVSSPAKPYVFSESAVTTFFAKSQPVARSDLGIESTITLNVTFSDSSTQLYALGPAPNDDTDTSVAWRSGRFQDAYAEIVVRVW